MEYIENVQGKNITITNSNGDNANNVQLLGDTQQNSYTGKNLFNYITGLQTSTYGLTSVLNKDGSITTTGIPTKNYVQVVLQYTITDMLEDNTQYVLSQENYEAGSNLRMVVAVVNKSTSTVETYITPDTTYRTFTVNKSRYTYNAWLQTNTTAAWGSSSRTFTNKYQLEKGSIPTDFEPYVGGTVSPNPDYPQEIKVVKGINNLLKNTTVNSGDYNYWYSYSTFDETTGEITRSTTTTSEAFIAHRVRNIKSGKTYTLSCLAKSNGYVDDMDFYCYNSSTQGIVLKQHIKLNTEYQRYVWTFTTKSEIDYYDTTIRFDNNGTQISGTEAILTIKDVMLEEGDTVHNYIPYEKQSLDIVTNGKNIFNINNIISNCTILNSGGMQNDNNANMYWLKVEPGETYTMSSGANRQWVYNFFTAQPNMDSTGTARAVHTAVNETFTVPTNYNYLCVRQYESIGETINNLQIEKGSAATSYEPYQGKEYLINMGDMELCKIGNYQDYIYRDGSKWYVHKEIGKFIPNSNSNITVRNNGDGSTTKSFTITLPTGCNIKNYGAEYIKCNNFVYEQTSTSGKEGLGVGSSDFTAIYAQIKRSRLNNTLTADDFKTWLTNNETIIYYVLQSPTNTEITDAETIRQLNELYSMDLPYGTAYIDSYGNLPAILGVNYNNWNKDINPTDRAALLDGTATIESEIEVVRKELCDGTTLNLYFDNNTSTLKQDNNCRMVYAKVPKNTDIIVSKASATNRFRIGLSNSVPAANTSFVRSSFWQDDTAELSATINSGEYEYVLVQYTNSGQYTDVQIKETPIVLNQNNSLISWNHEDFRYVKDEGFIGQFVARQLTGELKNTSDDFSITDKELILKLGVRKNNNTNWYSLGNFLVSKVTDDEVNDKTSFEALDFTKKFNQLYIDSLSYPCTAYDLAQNVCEQVGIELATPFFLNYDYVIQGNVFKNNETCRDVMKAIAKLAFSWVRVDWDNRVYLDFTKETILNDYNNADNSKYYNLKTQAKEKFGPVNRVIIGYSQIEGERTKIEDTSSIETNGVSELTIYDNPLVYTQEQRESIINSASDLLGLTYTPLNTQTIGHPWLKGKELFKVTNMEGNSHITLPFDRTIQYFGHIKTLIDVAAETKTNTEYAYEPEINKDLQQTEIQVNKNTGDITALTSRTTNLEDEMGNVYTIEQTNQLIQNAQTGITNTFSEAGGNNVFRNTGLWFANSDTRETGTVTGNNQLYVDDALERNAIEYSIDGNCYQDGEPSSGTWVDIDTIKPIENLFDKDNYGSLDNATISIDGTIAESSPISPHKLLYIYLPSGTYTITTHHNSNFGFYITTTSGIPSIGSQGTERVIGYGTHTITKGNNYLVIDVTMALGFNFNSFLNGLHIEKTSVSNDYVPYGYWSSVKVNHDNSQRRILIDMNRENLFSKEKVLQGTVDDNTQAKYVSQCIGRIDVGDKINIINNSFDYSTSRSYIYSLYVTDSVVQGGVTLEDYEDVSSTNLTFTSSTNGYLWITIECTDGTVTSISKDDLFNNSFYVYKKIGYIESEGDYLRYYELCKVGDVKDTLTIYNNQITINKRIGSFYQYSGEAPTTDYITTMGTFTYGGVTGYYVLQSPITITLPTTTAIALYADINYVTLMSDLETTTSLTYFKKYATFEYWDGNVIKIKEENASNLSALLLQDNTLTQEQTVPNGNYTVSFKYKKLIPLANVKCVINDIEYELTSTTDTEFMQTLEVSSQHINVKFISDIDNACEIYDIMVNAGTVKLAYSQNQNETTTDTVNISKGITITSTDTDTTFKANADGIRTLDKQGNVLTKFTDTGMTTKESIIENEAQIVGVLVQSVGEQTWFTRL